MADDLVLTVGGDISSLEASLNDIPAVAQESAAKIQAAFDALPSATLDAEQGLAALGDKMAEAGHEAETTAGNIGHIPPALHDTAEAAGEAQEKLAEFVKTGLELAGIVISLEAIKEATIGALETFGEFQRASEALTAISHNAAAASEAMERIPALADRLGVSITSLEMAQQKFALFGVELEAMPPLFEAIANAAVASGNDFDSVASSFERMDNTGKLMARTLQAAGLNMQDVAKAMDMEGASAKEVTTAFAALGEGAAGAAARAEVLIEATRKMDGIAVATANDITGSWNQMKNAVHEAMVNIGEALSQLSQAGGMSVLKTSIAGVETFVVSLIGYLGQAIDLVRGFSTIAVTEFTALGKAATDAAHGNFAQAWADIKAGDEQMVADFGAMSTKMQADWDANGKIIDKIWASTADGVNESSKNIGSGMDGAKASADALGDAATVAGGKITASFVGPIYQANLGIQMMSGAVKDATDRTAQMVDGIEVLNGTVSTLVDTFDAAKVTVIGAGDAFSQTAADLLAYVNDAADATAATDNLASALDAAASAAGSLGSELDQSMTAKLGSVSASVKPGQTVSDSHFLANVFGGLAAGWGSGTFGPIAPNDTFMFDPAGYAASMKQSTTSLQKAADTLQKAADTQQTAAWAAQDAAKMAGAVSQSINIVTNSLNSTALAAADAANAAAMNGLAVATVVTAATQTVAAATSLVAATTAAVAPILGFKPGGTNSLVPTAPNVSAPSLTGPGGANTMVGWQNAGSWNPSPGLGQLQVNVTVPGVLVGSGGIQELSQTIQQQFVAQLQNMGIRLTRG